MICYNLPIQIVSHGEMQERMRELSGEYASAMREDLLLQHLSPEHQKEMADNFANIKLGINSTIFRI